LKSNKETANENIELFFIKTVKRISGRIIKKIGNRIIRRISSEIVERIGNRTCIWIEIIGKDIAKVELIFSITLSILN